jgi:hypothetical protein
VRYFGPGTWSPTLCLDALLKSITSSLSSVNRFGDPVHIGMHVGASDAVCFGEATRVSARNEAIVNNQPRSCRRRILLSLGPSLEQNWSDHPCDILDLEPGGRRLSHGPVRPSHPQFLR